MGSKLWTRSPARPGWGHVPHPVFTYFCKNYIYNVVIYKRSFENLRLKME